MSDEASRFDTEALRAALGLPQAVWLHAVAWRAGGAEPFAGEPLPVDLYGASPRRQAQFRAGRYCARHALAQAVAGLMAPARGPDGLPVWPDGWTGSISHTSDRAVAVAARQDGSGAMFALGVDVEQWLAPDRADEIADMVALPDDIAVLAASLCRPRADAVTLLFSAKESLYKALYPTVCRFFDFSAARLAGSAPGTLSLALTCDWHERWPAGTVFEVQYALTPDEVVTAVCLG
ncbi:4'-phosphopantetheinyl transferase family protein [Cupriavidus agavae]|uniref:Enterobactin synthase component D n=1 Tax=Cupriavidus agavae TaxID=1001822 RepID=A0A4Q7S901_9BURK|nr:4'-phosphopantetheinyl transferase superfamily protein [Cupriavidus agavae]RZT42258.1 enterobactin synthetase component D [Cupriavidus agavae]